MKKALFLLVGSFLATGLVASAQTGVIVSPGQPANPPSADGGFVQFNNLVVQGVSSPNVPSEITATYGAYAVPMATGGGNATVPPSVISCVRYESDSASVGQTSPCPLPPVKQPAGPPVYQYRIEVSASTRIVLRDRSAGSVSDIAPGDQINVYGYYNPDGTIQAYLIRDISKPVQTQEIQLNNVQIISISGTGVPATIAVVQSQIAPCYGFTGGGSTPIACPMGVSSFSANAATQNVATPTALAPNWMMLRKYVITVDAQTLIMNRNRGALSLADLRVGDSLNVYGTTGDNAQTVNADIIRDVSQPIAVSSYSGTVSQVNADGSFVIQTTDGKTITVTNPVKAGVTVRIMGLLDQLSSILSQVTSITIGN